MTVVIPNTTKQWVLDGTIDLDDDAIRVMLVETDPTVDIDADSFLDDVTFDELDDASYSRQTIAGLTSSVDDTDDEGVIDGTDTTFSSLAGGENINAYLIYRQVGGDDTTPANDELICEVVTTEMPLTTNGSDVVIQWAAEGLFNLG